MGLDNPLHIAFLVVILLLVFGAKRLPEIGRSLGSGMREFKQSVTGDRSEVGPQQPTIAPAQQQPQPPVAQPSVSQPPVSQPPVAQPSTPQPPVQAPAAPPPPPPSDL